MMIKEITRHAYDLVRRGGLMVSVLDSGASGLGSSPDRTLCRVLEQDTFLSQCDSSPR